MRREKSGFCQIVNRVFGAFILSTVCFAGEKEGAALPPVGRSVDPSSVSALMIEPHLDGVSSSNLKSTFMGAQSGLKLQASLVGKGSDKNGQLKIELDAGAGAASEVRGASSSRPLIDVKGQIKFFPEFKGASGFFLQSNADLLRVAPLMAEQGFWAGMGLNWSSGFLSFLISLYSNNTDLQNKVSAWSGPVSGIRILGEQKISERLKIKGSVEGKQIWAGNGGLAVRPEKFDSGEYLSAQLAIIAQMSKRWTIEGSVQVEGMRVIKDVAENDRAGEYTTHPMTSRLSTAISF